MERHDHQRLERDIEEEYASTSSPTFYVSFSVSIYSNIFSACGRVVNVLPMRISTGLICHGGCYLIISPWGVAPASGKCMKILLAVEASLMSQISAKSVDVFTSTMLNVIVTVGLNILALCKTDYTLYTKNSKYGPFTLIVV